MIFPTRGRGFIDFDRRHDNDMALRHIDDRHRRFGERQKQSLAFLEGRDFENIAAAEPRFEIIDGAAPSSNSLEVVLPAGMHDDAVLDRAIATGKPFRGLVVSVGVNDVEGRSANHPDLMHSIGFFIRGLIVENEFACRTGEAEFLIVCPGLQGFAAQRRLNQIAEQLWDYQLRGISTWSIVFSWGGADVHHQSLSDAVAMANEQMNDTRRGRRLVSIDSGALSRRAAI